MSPRSTRVLIGAASTVVLTAIGLRAFVFDERPGWDIALWAVQGVAMATVLLLWRRLDGPRERRGVDMKAKRLHW
ncbi:hypothetical protein KOI35_22125 [Actinoplanes bogorensis]|uniref:Uncharacterized protein n=1 Tax=Paractinoplanes bogorensis TaxID=1610840 RepID=A0ABS5YRX6_9ACTN|nr:hypothetical protein [Actinoplanes bogorensis]MBU2666202.1 hypothetical protein [Actinoplanes bogorensis]